MRITRQQPIFFLAVALVAAMAATVFAASGDNQGPGSYGRGWHRGAGDGPACLQNLSEEDRAKIESERQAFFDATDELRRELYRKRLALKSEMAKKTPDPEAARALQKELSELYSQLGQQRIDHLLKIKAINPACGDWGGRKWGGHGKGRGQGCGGMYSGD
jgi:Spy/CpxP family protein refolding chaperone